MISIQLHLMMSKKKFDENKIEWRNQTSTGVIGRVEDEFFDEQNGRIKFTKYQRTAL